MIRFNIVILYTVQVSCLSICVREVDTSVSEESAASIFVLQEYAYEYSSHEDPRRRLMVFAVGSELD
jgi:hypothetical protein